MVPKVAQMVPKQVSHQGTVMCIPKLPKLRKNSFWEGFGETANTHIPPKKEILTRCDRIIKCSGISVTKMHHQCKKSKPRQMGHKSLIRAVHFSGLPQTLLVFIWTIQFNLLEMLLLMNLREQQRNIPVPEVSVPGSCSFSLSVFPIVSTITGHSPLGGSASPGFCAMFQLPALSLLSLFSLLTHLGSP